MNIKFFAPGSKESHCPALPKSQGYSHNKQSCPSPGETDSPRRPYAGVCTGAGVHTHTHTQMQDWRRKEKVGEYRRWTDRSRFYTLGLGTG